MVRSILIGILTIALIGVGYWGYKEHEEKNSLLIHAENSYQRSFHELTYHMDLLHDKIGTSLAMNSGKRLSPQLVEIWRLTSNALTNVGQLPLTLLPFNKTEEFLSQIGDFTYKTAIRDLDNEPLTNEEIKTLEKLYEQSKEIKDELRKVQHKTLTDNLRWMDVELALATEDEQMDNTIIDGFKTVEKSVSEFSEGSEGIEFIGQTVKEPSDKHLKGKRKTKEEIEQFARKLFDLDDSLEVTVTKTEKGAKLPTYSVTYKDGKNVYMDITERGGYPLQILVERKIGDNKLSLYEGLQKAEKYLKTFSYGHMVPFQTQQYDNVGLYSFVYEQDGVRIYPDAVTVKVALDNGEIIGLNATDYVLNHQERSIPKEQLTIEEAREYVHPNVDIQEEHIAIIENDVGEEVLTYEFLGVLNDDTFRIFINAENGFEERVEKLNDPEINFDLA